MLTNSTLLLPTKWDVVAQRIILIDPNLALLVQEQYTLCKILPTVPASNADETRMHWLASSVVYKTVKCSLKEN